MARHGSHVQVQNRRCDQDEQGRRRVFMTATLAASFLTLLCARADRARTCDHLLFAEEVLYAGRGFRRKYRMTLVVFNKLVDCLRPSL